MSIEELVKALPAKQAEALKRKYDALAPEQRDSFLQKASDVIRKYSDNTVKIANERDKESRFMKANPWVNPFVSNADPMALKMYDDFEKKDNRDPMVLQAELDAKNKKSYVMPPSVFKKKPVKSTTVVEWYMSLDPNQYMTPIPKNIKKPVDKKSPYITWPEAIKNRKENAKWPNMTTWPEAIKEIFKRWESIPKYASWLEGLKILLNK